MWQRLVTSSRSEFYMISPSPSLMKGRVAHININTASLCTQILISFSSGIYCHLGLDSGLIPFNWARVERLKLETYPSNYRNKLPRRTDMALVMNKQYY
jgi:hypothetical protein